MAADPTYGPKIQERNGGDLLAVASGGVLDVETGGELRFNGTDKAAALAAAVATPVAGVAAGYKGGARRAHAGRSVDTVVTGLATVVAVVAQFQSAPTVKQLFCAGDIGTQAGAPAAGSILIKTYKPTAVNDVTPIPATDFTDNLVIAWVAVGT
jgi:hypothetical protein